MPFPLLKFVSLGLKQASKFVAIHVKNEAKSNPTFKKYIVRAAQRYHRLKTTLNLKYLNMGKDRKIEPLSEESALTLGVEVLGESVIYILGIVLYFTFDYTTKSKDYSEEKFEKIFDELDEMKETIKDQGIKIEQQDAKIRHLDRLLRGSTMFTETSNKVINKSG